MPQTYNEVRAEILSLELTAARPSSAYLNRIHNMISRLVASNKDEAQEIEKLHRRLKDIQEKA
jgi:gas vesicle protein